MHEMAKDEYTVSKYKISELMLMRRATASV